MGPLHLRIASSVEQGRAKTTKYGILEYWNIEEPEPEPKRSEAKRPNYELFGKRFGSITNRIKIGIIIKYTETWQVCEAIAA